MAKVYYKVKIDGKWLFRRTPHNCECANCTYTGDVNTVIRPKEKEVCKPENHMYHFDGEYCPECGTLGEEE